MCFEKSLGRSPLSLRVSRRIAQIGPPVDQVVGNERVCHNNDAGRHQHDVTDDSAGIDSDPQTGPERKTLQAVAAEFKTNQDGREHTNGRAKHERQVRSDNQREQQTEHHRDQQIREQKGNFVLPSPLMSPRKLKHARGKYQREEQYVPAP